MNNRGSLYAAAIGLVLGIIFLHGAFSMALDLGLVGNKPPINPTTKP